MFGWLSLSAASNETGPEQRFVVIEVSRSSDRIAEQTLRVQRPPLDDTFPDGFPSVVLLSIYYTLEVRLGVLSAEAAPACRLEECEVPSAWL